MKLRTLCNAMAETRFYIVLFYNGGYNESFTVDYLRKRGGNVTRLVELKAKNPKVRSFCYDHPAEMMRISVDMEEDYKEI